MTRSNSIRRARKGGALAVSLFFVVLVAVAGGALLSMSSITRMNIVRQSADVRLMIAAEAGIETVRGRFTLVQGVQDDWSALMPTGGWNNVGGTLNINGIDVQPQVKPTGHASVLQARLRAVATLQGKTRVVEYTIQAANFGDYALYFGASNTVTIGSHFKMVGNFYSKGHINVANRPGVEFFNRVESSGAVMNYPDFAYNFKQGYNDYIPVIEIPPEAYGLAPMRAAAEATGTLFYANTISIRLDGEDFIRTYAYRKTGNKKNYKKNEYEIRAERIEIPDNSVIYIDENTAPPGVDSWSGHSKSSNNADYGQLDLWGVIDHKRVTIASESDISIVNNVSYRTLLDYPDLRRFTQKKSPGALGFREMLGVLSDGDIRFETKDWSPLPYDSRVWDDESRNPPDVGHQYYQYSLDGVFMGVNKAARTAVGPSRDRELWLNGSIINGNYPSTALANNFDRRNYDTDYRLQKTTPPYFMKAYGKSATFISGTWRTYEL